MCACVRAHVCVTVYLCVCVCISMYVHSYVCIYLCVYVWVHVSVKCVCVCVLRACLSAVILQAFEKAGAVVQKRIEWLVAVLKGPEKCLAELILKAQGQPGDEIETVAGESRDPKALANSGPCAGYEDLTVFSTLIQHATRFRSCTSQQEIKEVAGQVAQQKKLYSVLMASCKNALKELELMLNKYDSDREKERKDEEAKKKKAEEEASKKKVAAKKKGTPQGLQEASHPVLDLEPKHGRDSHSVRRLKAGEKMPLCVPWIWCAGPHSGLPEEVTKALDEFGNAFATSSLKVRPLAYLNSEARIQMRGCPAFLSSGIDSVNGSHLVQRCLCSNSGRHSSDSWCVSTWCRQ